MLIKAIVAILVLPGFVLGVIPAILISCDPWGNGGHWSGYLLLLPGFLILFRSIRDFYVAGKGTLAPWAPPDRIVRTGFYSHMRNPMYAGIIMSISGMGICFGSPLTGAYMLLMVLIFHTNLVFLEEPRLADKYGQEWDRYARNVPRWIPRIRSIRDFND